MTAFANDGRSRTPGLPCLARPAARPRHQAERAGVLLLVVVSMLTLMTLLGTAYFVASTRARNTAQAFANAVSDAEGGRRLAAPHLDAVLMNVLRGGPVATLAPATRARLSDQAPKELQDIVQKGIALESLLADKYGQESLTGKTVAFKDPTGLQEPNTRPLIMVDVELDPRKQAAKGEDPPPIEAIELVGRVMTFLAPRLEQGASGVPRTFGVSSHRILRATGVSGGPFRLVLDGATTPPVIVPTANKAILRPGTEVPIVINGREFTPSNDKDVNEPWDAFDHENNPFLACIEPDPASLSQSIVQKFSYLPTSAIAGLSPADLCDNDGDGQPDSVFLDFGLPEFIEPSGDVMRLDAAVLIVDLDSRINVNAHGSLIPSIYPSGRTDPSGATVPRHQGWPEGVEDIPLGTGYGPAEIDLAKVFAPPAYGNKVGENPERGGRKGLPTPVNPRRSTGEYPQFSILTGAASDLFLARRTPTTRFRLMDGSEMQTPRLGSVKGRYAGPSEPGLPSGFKIEALPQASISTDGLDDLAKAGVPVPAAPKFGIGSQPQEWWKTAQSGTAVNPDSMRKRYATPPDLAGRMKTYTSKAGEGLDDEPETQGGEGKPVVPTLHFVKPEWDNTENVVDTYRTNLALGIDTSAASAKPIGRPFTLGDLERVLRPYDRDTQQANSRLEALLGSAAEEARLRVTTHSWDTTALTGEAAQRVMAKLREASAKSEATAENYTVTMYGKDLPEKPKSEDLGGIISGEIARGERFDLSRPLYDAGPAMTADFRKQAYFKDLYTLLLALEPEDAKWNGDDKKALAQWVANVIDFQDADSEPTVFKFDRDPFDKDGWKPASGDEVIGAERPEVLIAEVDVEKQEANSNEANLTIRLHRPWHMKAHVGSKDTAITPDLDVSKWKIGVEGGKEVPLQQEGEDGQGKEVKLTSNGWSIDIPLSEVDVQDKIDVKLQLKRPRDAEPSKFDIVDEVTVLTAGTSQKYERATSDEDTAFWKPELVVKPTLDDTGERKIRELSADNPDNLKNITWFHWPDRPLVSPAELHLVPGGNAVEMLKHYRKRPQWKEGKSVAELLAETRLLDAVQVRSRFYAMTVPTSDPHDVMGVRTGIYKQLGDPAISRYREPGRVNLNTVTSEDVWHAVVGGRMATIADAFTWEERPKNDQEPVWTGMNRILAMKPKTRASTPPPQPAPDEEPTLVPMYDDGAKLEQSATEPDYDGTGQASRKVKLPTERNPWHELFTATRLANTATTRSHVFAIWITVRASRVGHQDDEPLYYRGFYVVDRSIPVAYQEGQDHNVGNMVLLRRVF